MEKSHQITRISFRFVIWFVPYGALLTVEAPLLVSFLLGPAFRDSILLFQILLWCAITLTVVSMAATVLLALNRLRIALMLLLPLLVLSPFFYWMVVPHWGSPGTAAVTLGITLAAALLTTMAVYSFLKISVPWGTLIRAGLISCAVVLFCSLSINGFSLHLGRIALVTCVIPLCFFLSGEFSRGEILILREILGEFLPFWRSKMGEKEQESLESRGN
jgi:O-antigen/teichoic acid export membrane protein